MVWLRGKSATRSRRMRASARGGPQRLSTPHAFSRRLRSQVKGSPLDVPPRQRGRSSRRCLAFPAIRRCGRRPAGSRLPHPGGRASGMGAQWRGASDLPHRRVRPPARLAHPAWRRPVSAPGADVPARPAGDARPCDPCGRGGSRLTIEAGLLLKEYTIRGLVRRALILTPASLTGQWREEMESKFELPFAVLRSVGDWERRPLLVASIDTAKRDPHRVWAQRTSWDLVIVDEAHRLKNRLSVNWRFVAGLSKK